MVDDDFPPPPPDALGLPPKTGGSIGSLEDIEVFKDVNHKRAQNLTRDTLVYPQTLYFV